MRPEIAQLLEKVRRKPALDESSSARQNLFSKQTDEPNNFITRFFYEIAWTKWQQVEVYGSTVFLTASAVIVWFFVLTGSSKPDIEIRPEMNAREMINRGFVSDVVNQDQVAKFVIDTLTLLKRVDDNGNPYLPLLRGYVNPDIYEQVALYIDDNAQVIRENGIIQNLNITRILNVTENTENGRIAAYVRGYYSIFTEPKGTRTEVKIIPYRARIKLEPNVRSEVNDSPFYMFELKEAIGDQVKEWDAEEDLS